MTWRVGMEAVCISDEYQLWVPAPYPLKGEVYTVSEILHDDPRGETGLQFIELRFEGDVQFFPGFKASAFRPVRTTKVGIAVLKGLLIPRPVKTRAKAGV